jgi:hypothetical protein
MQTCGFFLRKNPFEFIDFHCSNPEAALAGILKWLSSLRGVSGAAQGGFSLVICRLCRPAGNQNRTGAAKREAFLLLRCGVDGTIQLRGRAILELLWSCRRYRKISAGFTGCGKTHLAEGYGL